MKLTDGLISSRPLCFVILSTLYCAVSHFFRNPLQLRDPLLLGRDDRPQFTLSPLCLRVNRIDRQPTFFRQPLQFSHSSLGCFLSCPNLLVKLLRQCLDDVVPFKRRASKAEDL